VLRIRNVTILNGNNTQHKKEGCVRSQWDSRFTPPITRIARRPWWEIRLQVDVPLKLRGHESSHIRWGLTDGSVGSLIRFGVAQVLDGFEGGLGTSIAGTDPPLAVPQRGFVRRSLESRARKRSRW